MKTPDLASSSDGVCAKCSKQAKSRCSSCEKVYYCSLEHQHQHWPEHERECATYKVLVREHVGRYGVASRDLGAGKVVFTESAVAVGPKVDSPPLCLGCYAFVDGSSLCTLCGWPVCGPQCQDSPQHATNECPIFKEAGVKFQSVEDFNIPSPQYECIAPLRALLSRESNLDRWDAEVTVMEAHNSKRRETDVWGVNQVNTVDFLRKQCKLADRFDEELIHTICGLFEVNAFEIRTAHGSSLRGLYPQTAILSHNCVANTSHTISPGEQFRLTLRTTVPVRSGQELYTSYTHSLEPTLVRRENLSRGKYFDCSCTRCKDPTELGTHLGTLKCNKCDPGLILSTNPLDPEAQWKCSHCEFSTGGGAVRRVLSVIQAEMDAVEWMPLDEQSVEARERLWRKYRSVLHPRHAFITCIRLSLSQLYGRVPGYRLDEMPDILHERKIEICKDLMAVADVLEPGLTRLRGMTLYELHAPIMIYAEHRHDYGELDEQALKNKLEEAAQILEEAVSILKLEDPDTPEGTIGRIAEQSFDQLKASIRKEKEKEKDPTTIDV